MDNVTAIAMAEAIDQLNEQENINKLSLEDKLKIAMGVTKNHWLQTNEEEQLLAAINAVIYISNEEDQKVLKENIEELRAISAMINGVPVDLNKITNPQKRISILEMWGNI